MQDMHARERERILLNTEREKSNIMAASYKKIEQETIFSSFARGLRVVF
jgi:hypothetical protein